MADKSKWRKQMAQSILDDAPFFPTTNDHIARALAAKQAPFQSSGEVRSTPGILGVDRTEYGLPTRKFLANRIRDFAGQAAYEVPGLGEALSARDAATAARRGDYIAAGASALAANPFWPAASASKGAIEDMVRMYHSTSVDGEKGIKSLGKILQPVFLARDRSLASEYADGIVFDVDVPKRDLMIDADLPGGRLLTVSQANDYFGNRGWTIDDYLRGPYSFAVDRDVSLEK